MLYYELNLLQNGKHLFASKPETVKTLKDAQKLHELFSQHFAASDGFEVVVFEIRLSANKVTFPKSAKYE